jgi:hypothetical protein
MIAKAEIFILIGAGIDDGKGGSGFSIDVGEVVEGGGNAWRQFRGGRSGRFCWLCWLRWLLGLWLDRRGVTVGFLGDFLGARSVLVRS